MKETTKFELAKIKSLMERIEKPHTGFQAMVNEDSLINEAKTKPEDRRQYNDLIELLYDKNWDETKKHFVRLGYVFSAATPTTIYPTPQNQKDLDNLVNGNENTAWGTKLQGYKNDDRWSKIMSGKGKTVSFRGGGMALIAIVPYTIQWQSGADFNNWYNERKQGMDKLAQEYGVNPMKAQQETEENKIKKPHIYYKGKFKNGQQPIFGGRYGDSEEGEIARYKDGTEKLALKHVNHLDNIKKGKTLYFYLNENGEYVEIPGNVYSFMKFRLGAKPAQEAQENLQAQEEESLSAVEQYAKKLKEYKAETSKMIQQFVLRQIGYLTATVKDDTQVKEPVVFINKNVDASEASKPFEVNKEALYKVLCDICKQEKQNVIQDAANANI